MCTTKLTMLLVDKERQQATLVWQKQADELNIDFCFVILL